jgi:hypothetical protein
MDLVWDVSRTAGPEGVRFHWDEDTGWSYALVRLVRDGALARRPLALVHRVFAVPEAVAEMAESLVRSWRTSAGEYGAEWDQACEGPRRFRTGLWPVAVSGVVMRSRRCVSVRAFGA